jgi:hypothetical protein
MADLDRPPQVFVVRADYVRCAQALRAGGYAAIGWMSEGPDSLLYQRIWAAAIALEGLEHKPVTHDEVKNNESERPLCCGGIGTRQCRPRLCRWQRASVQYPARDSKQLLQ